MGGSKPAVPLWTSPPPPPPIASEVAKDTADSSIAEVKHRMATGALGRMSLFSGGGELGFQRNLGAS